MTVPIEDGMQIDQVNGKPPSGFLGAKYRLLAPKKDITTNFHFHMLHHEVHAATFVSLSYIIYSKPEVQAQAFAEGPRLNKQLAETVV